jgi:hypothetical protein
MRSPISPGLNPCMSASPEKGLNPAIAEPVSGGNSDVANGHSLMAASALDPSAENRSHEYRRLQCSGFDAHLVEPLISPTSTLKLHTDSFPLKFHYLSSFCYHSFCSIHRARWSEYTVAAVH